MTKVVFVSADGARREVDDPSARTIMEAARFNDISGILGDCGGSLTCGTCHGYIDPKWSDLLPPVSGNEADILEGVFDRRAASRLTCQIPLTPDLDGIIVHLPDRQLDY